MFDEKTMTRLRKLGEMTHVVECRMSLHGGFEAIAAFNVERAAQRYSTECEHEHPDFAYRVVAL